MNTIGNFGRFFGSVIKSLIYGILIYMLIITIASILLWLTPLPESAAVFMAMGALCIASLVSGAFGGNYFKRRGFLYGSFYALILLAVILFIYMLFFPDTAFTVKGSLKYLICLLFGSIGGMIAVNR